MKIIIPFCLLAFIFSSCLIQLNTGNGYKYLSNDYKNIISKLTSFDSVENRKIYEINGLQLREELAKHDSALVYIHTPKCAKEACLPLSTFQNYSEKYNLKVFFLLERYSGIEELLLQDFDAPLFAIDVAYYGNNKSWKYIPTFKKDLGCQNACEGECISNRFIFHKDKAIRTISLDNDLQ